MQLTYPGVYVTEIPSSVRPIATVSTSIAAFVDRFATGDVDKAVQIFGMADFERLFGGIVDYSPASYQLAQFFLNGGSSAWIVRVAPGADDADVKVMTAGSSPTDVFTATARSPGEWGNGLRLSVEPVVEGGNVSSRYFSLGVTRYVSKTSSTVVATERFATLDNNNFAASVNDVAQLVRLTSHASTQPAFSGTLGNKKIQATTGLSGKTFHVNGRPASLELPAGIAAATPLTHVNIRAMVETAIRKAGAASPVEATLVGATVTLVGGRLWIRTDPRTPGYTPDKRIAITTMATDTLDLNAIGMDAAFASVQEYELVGADDGVAADPTTIKGDPSAKTGLWALENADLFNILCLPITTELDDASAQAVMDAQGKRI